jgi:hypothetical protein
MEKIDSNLAYNTRGKTRDIPLLALEKEKE